MIYCWGLEQSMKLKGDSQELLKDGVEIRMLDAIIRDAIKICRGLVIHCSISVG